MKGATGHKLISKVLYDKMIPRLRHEETTAVKHMAFCKKSSLETGTGLEHLGKIREASVSGAQ